MYKRQFHTSSAVEQKIISFAAQFAGGEAVAEQLLKLFPLRKIAHFTEYMILGCFSTAGYWYYQREKRKTEHSSVLPVMGFCTLLAALDEFHQAFVPGRTSSLWDVLLDSVGAFTGIFLSACVIKKIREMKKQG